MGRSKKTLDDNPLKEGENEHSKVGDPLLPLPFGHSEKKRPREKVHSVKLGEKERGSKQTGWTM